MPLFPDAIGGDLNRTLTEPCVAAPQLPQSGHLKSCAAFWPVRCQHCGTKPTLVLFAFAHAASLRACGGPYAATQLKSRKRPFASFYFVARGVGCSGQSPAFSSHPKTQSLRKRSSHCTKASTTTKTAGRVIAYETKY